MSNPPANSAQPIVSDLIKGDENYLQEIQAQLDSGEITEEQWTEIQRFFVENKYGPIQPSIICKAEGCPYVKACPLKRAKMPLPKDKPCPIEESTKTLWFHQLSGEIGSVDDGYDATDLGVACDIINILIQKQRVQWEMVKNPEVATRTIVGMTPQGEPIVDLKANPSFFALKALNQQQIKLSESLMTTREARSKDQSRKTADSAVQFAAMQEIIQRVKQLHTRDDQGRPITAFDALAKLPAYQTSDDLLNKDDDEEEDE